MNNPNKKRLRRTMMFLNAQKPGLIKDPYIYKADSLMLDLEDAVAENQKDVARFSLYHALKTVDYRGAERVVRINGLDTPYWREDIRACVAGGCDSIRIPKTEHAEDVRRVAAAIAEDEGASYFGEVALVPYDSPISNQKILFYNTLFDENAACHLAFGEAYPECVKGGEAMSKEELKAAGLNDSNTHVDFMVGSKDLSIVGTTHDGKEIKVFENGNFVI